MFVLLNMSKKLEGFNLYDNCFYPLLRDNSIGIIDLSKQVDEAELDFSSIKTKIEACLVKSKSSKYSIIVLYDFDMQKKNTLIFSITGLLNNINDQIIKILSHSYALDNVYFISLDDVERDYDGSIIDEDLRNSVIFDKYGYIYDPNHKSFLSNNDFVLIDDGLKTLINKYKKDDKLANHTKLYKEFITEYIEPIEKRICNEIELNETKNDSWYDKKIRYVFNEYKNEIKNFLSDMADGDNSLEDLNFSLKNYVEDNISSYSMQQQNKIFRLNMLDRKGKYCRDEEKFKNYYKIISFVYYLVVEDKKYIFGHSLSIKENHYTVSVDISDDKIKELNNLYYKNLINEKNRLGEIKFSEFEVEDFEHYPIDTNVENNKISIPPKVKFSLFRKDENNKITIQYAEYLKERYINFVNYCNQRLRKITDKLRVTKNKESSGRKRTVSLNEMQRIIDDKKTQKKELEEIIAANTPNDIIAIDFQVFEENDKTVEFVNSILSQRITILHFILNLIVILFVSFILLPILRRFDLGFLSIIKKFLICLIPCIIYALCQMFFSFIKVDKAKKEILKMDSFMKEKINNIKLDDEKFNIYVNNIFKLMILTKYIDKLENSVVNSSIDVENFRYHRNEIENSIKSVETLSKLLRIKLDANYPYNTNIQLDFDENKEENKFYCPLNYLNENKDKYLLVNSQHRENINSPLLNIVNCIEFNYDEVYEDND